MICHHFPSTLAALSAFAAGAGAIRPEAIVPQVIAEASATPVDWPQWVDSVNAAAINRVDAINRGDAMAAVYWRFACMNPAKLRLETDLVEGRTRHTIMFGSGHTEAVLVIIEGDSHACVGARLREECREWLSEEGLRDKAESVTKRLAAIERHAAPAT